MRKRLCYPSCRWAMLLFVFGAGLAPAPALTPEAVQTEIRAWLEHHIPLSMTEAAMPGFSIAVVREGETLYAEGFGSRDPQKSLPATPDTLYGIGSLTKSFVAIAVMQLVEQGKLRLDEPVSHHIPFELGMPGRPITVHHLLTHSLGLPSLATSTVAIHRGLGRDLGVPLSSVGDFYRFVNSAQDEIVAPPGERFFYHNAGWRMLGHLIQVSSGVAFHTYLEEKVIRPLGMTRTTLDVMAFESDPDHMVPQLRGPDGHQPARFPYPNPHDIPEFSFIAAAGGVLSSVNEMTRYLNAQIEQGAYPGGRLASAASFERMQKAQIERPDGYYGDEAYGYGLVITRDFLGQELIHHSGSVAVSTAYMAFIPARKVGVVMMGNSSGMPYATIAESVLAILLGEDPAQVVPAHGIRERAQQLAGRYEVYRGLERLRVVIQGGMLYLEQTAPFSGETEMTPLIPEDPALESTRFYILRSGLKSPVEFRVRDSGGVDLYLGRYCYHKQD